MNVWFTKYIEVYRNHKTLNKQKKILVHEVTPFLKSYHIIIAWKWEGQSGMGMGGVNQ